MKLSAHRHLSKILISVLAASTLSFAIQGEAANFEGFRVVPDSELAALRGGFEINAGGIPLKLSFSIEQITYINDRLVASTRLQLPDLNNISATLRVTQTGSSDQLPQTTFQNLASQDQLGVNLIQNGPGNTFSIPSINLLDNLSTIIQNTLDNQAIRTQTIISASLASASLARALAISDSVNQALARGLR